MKILFDQQVFTWQENGGVSRYFANLIENLSKAGILIDIPPGFVSNKIINKNFSQLKLLFPNLYIPGKIPAMKVINSIITKRKLMSGSYDIFHPTGYNSGFLSRLDQKPFVLTVFDMIHEVYPEYFSNNNSTRKSKKKLIRKASAIISISQSTKKDLINIYNVNPQKIHVIPLASSISNKSMDKFELPQKYILYVGERHSYKNFSFFTKGVMSILEKDKNMHIVCVGGGKLTTEEKKSFAKYRSRFQQLNLTDKQLAFAYSSAKAFVYPSMTEGFGMPLLEAMSCKCPVFCSDIQVFREVAGQAAIYFNPQKLNSFIKTISENISNKSLMFSLANKGCKQAKKYSWEKNARQTLSVYKKILRDNE